MERGELFSNQGTRKKKKQKKNAKTLPTKKRGKPQTNKQTNVLNSFQLIISSINPSLHTHTHTNIHSHKGQRDKGQIGHNLHGEGLAEKIFILLQVFANFLNNFSSILIRLIIQGWIGRERGREGGGWEERETSLELVIHIIHLYSYY